MKKLAFMFIALVAILSVSACRIEKVNNSDEPAKSYTLNLRDFQTIKNYSNCDIHFTQSNTYKVVLKATPRWYDAKGREEAKRHHRLTFQHHRRWCRTLDLRSLVRRYLYRRQWRLLCRKQHHRQKPGAVHLWQRRQQAERRYPLR